MRGDIIKASIKQFDAHIERHRINIEILLMKVVGVAEHPDIIDTIEKELGHMADYHDKMEVLKRYFVKENEKEVING